ncbi:hypothetical protein GQ457_06G015270 [Hibiscus cannabinus]
MVDSLLAKLGDLTFTTEEQDAVVVTLDAVAIPAEDFASSLVGKVVSPPTVVGSRLIRQFRSIWKDDKVLNISEINPNFFLIFFASPVNRTNVLKRGPWDFQKYWFPLEHADPNQTIHDYSFLHKCIWVRIHNIPLSLMTAALARVLGASVGKVIMTDTRLEDGNMGEFMRVHIFLHTSKPLRRCVFLSRPDAKASMCPLQYECLPLFCHGCGLIGHSVLVCPTTPKVEGQKFQYGAWLRAPLPKRSATRPRGRLSIVDDDLDAPVTVDSASGGPSVRLVSLRAAWLTGGCCASRESVWPPLGGVLQFRFYWPYHAVAPIGGAARYWPGLAWMLPGTLLSSPLSRGRGCLYAPLALSVATFGARLWLPWELSLPLQHSRALRFPRLDMGLSCALRLPRHGVGLAAVLALLFDWQHVAVLAVGASWVLSCFASFSLTWCTNVELVLWISSLRTILQFFVCCAYGAALVFRPSQRLSYGKELAAITNVCFEQSPKTATVGSHPRRTRPLSGCLRPTLGLFGPCLVCVAAPGRTGCYRGQ